MGTGDQLGTRQPPGEVQWGRQGSSFGQQAVLALLNSKWKGLRHPPVLETPVLNLQVKQVVNILVGVGWELISMVLKDKNSWEGGRVSLFSLLWLTVKLVL